MKTFLMLIRVVAFTIATIGLLGCLGGIGPLVERLAPAPVEYPVTAIDDIAISASGDLYLAQGYADRVQRYSGRGAFIGGFATRSRGRRMCIDIVADRLRVHVPIRNAVDEYDLEGRIIRTDLLPDSVRDASACKSDSRIRAVDHNIAAATISFRDERAPAVIPRRLWHYLAPHPIISLLYFALGLVLYPGWLRAAFSGLRK